MCSFLFVGVDLVRQNIVPAPQCQPCDFEPVTLQGENFAPNEAMAYFGVMVDEIRNSQDRHYEI
jgi:hypothetical protein